jgi:creatinine amidohydrolase
VTSVDEMQLLTWPEVEALRGKSVIGLIPLGAMEQHGPHLPLATDSLIAEHLARLVAARLGRQVLIAPVLPGGISGHHLYFSGTVNLPATVVEGFIAAYIEAFERIRIRDVAIFSSHGGNFDLLAKIEATYEQSDVNVFAYSDLPQYLETMFAGARRAGFDPTETDVHAGGIETSQALAAFPELTRPYDDLHGYTAAEEGWRTVLMDVGIHDLSETGVLGNPSAASKEVGDAIFEALCSELTSWIGHHVNEGSGVRDGFV